MNPSYTITAETAGCLQSGSHKLGVIRDQRPRSGAKHGGNCPRQCFICTAQHIGQSAQQVVVVGAGDCSKNLWTKEGPLPSRIRGNPSQDPVDPPLERFVLTSSELGVPHDGERAIPLLGPIGSHMSNSILE